MDSIGSSQLQFEGSSKHLWRKNWLAHPLNFPMKQSDLPFSAKEVWKIPQTKVERYHLLILPWTVQTWYIQYRPSTEIEKFSSPISTSHFYLCSCYWKSSNRIVSQPGLHGQVYKQARPLNPATSNKWFWHFNNILLILVFGESI